MKAFLRRWLLYFSPDNQKLTEESGTNYSRLSRFRGRMVTRVSWVSSTESCTVHAALVRRRQGQILRTGKSFHPDDAGIYRHQPQAMVGDECTRRLTSGCARQERSNQPQSGKTKEIDSETPEAWKSTAGCHVTAINVASVTGFFNDLIQTQMILTRSMLALVSLM